MLQSIIIKRLKVDNPFVLLVTIGVFSLITSCGHQKRIHANQVDKIVFYAVAKGIDRCHSMSWEEVMYEGRDTVITDRDFINEFIRLTNKLKPLESDYDGIDCRSVAFVKMQSGASIRMEFGYFHRIRIDGIQMSEDPLVFAFIDKYVYGPHEQDWYYWFTDEERRFLIKSRQYFEQLDSLSHQ